VPLFDPLRDPPTPMLPGDAVLFDSVSREEYDRLDREYWGDVKEGQSGNQATGQLGQTQSPDRPIAKSTAATLAPREAFEILRADSSRPCRTGAASHPRSLA